MFCIMISSLLPLTSQKKLDVMTYQYGREAYI